MPPGERVGEVHQCFGVEQAKAETAIDHQSRSVSLPARVVGQGIELGGPDHDVLQIPPGEIRAEGTRWHETVNSLSDRNLLWSAVGVLHTFVPAPGQIFRQPEGPRLTFPCESGCTRYAGQR